MNLATLASFILVTHAMWKFQLNFGGAYEKWGDNHDGEG